MKKLQLTAMFLILSASAAMAQTLTEKEISSFKNDYNNYQNAKAIQNVVMSNATLKELVHDHSVTNSIDHNFKYRVDVKGITNQQSSGRCWMFTSYNMLRPAAIKKFNVNGNFHFSKNYLYFFDMLEKANLFLENIIATTGKSITDEEVVFYLKNPVDDGGVWNLFYNLAEKYGVVPADVMPETIHSNNTDQLAALMKELLRGGAYKIRTMADAKAKESALREQKLETMSQVYRLLAFCLGEPPTQFTWRYTNNAGEDKTLTTTPMEFYKSIIPENYNPQQYIMIMNDPTREYYKVYEIANYRNSIEGINWIYLNLPNDEIKASALASIKANQAMYASCDVAKQMNITDGVLALGQYDYQGLLGIDLTSMDKKARILTRQSGSSHAMLLMACDTDENDKPVKWQFENSWGPKGHNGYLTFTDGWFDEYMFRIVINKQFLSEKAQKAATQKPELLPAWDYMF